MATLSPDVSNDVLRGLPVLQELIMNHAVGVLPHEAVQRTKDTYEVDLADLRASAPTEDRDERRMIEINALAKAAYAMGKHDGARILASRRGLSAEMSIEDFRSVVVASSSVPKAAPGYKQVMDSYVRGMRAAAAILYVARNNPMERRRQVAEARAVRGSRDPLQAEDVVQVSKVELEAASGVDLNSYATALAAYAMAEETAEIVAGDVLVEQVTELTRSMPRLTTTEALQRARLAQRAAAVGDLAQKSYGRIAWTPVSMRRIEQSATEARETSAELVVETPRAAQGLRR